jgi:hypothetical protein
MDFALFKRADGTGQMLKRIASTETGELWLAVDVQSLMAFVAVHSVRTGPGKGFAFRDWSAVSKDVRCYDLMKDLLNCHGSQSAILATMRALRWPKEYTAFFISCN